MSKLEDFTKCVIETEVDGRTCLDCKLGLWGVSSSDTGAYLEAFHYWQQYNEDGEYYKILGGENEKVKKMV